MTRRNILSAALAPVLAPLLPLVWDPPYLIESFEGGGVWQQDPPRPITSSDFSAAADKALWMAFYYPDGTPRPSDAGALFTIKGGVE